MALASQLGRDGGFLEFVGKNASRSRPRESGERLFKFLALSHALKGGKTGWYNAQILIRVCSLGYFASIIFHNC